MSSPPQFDAGLLLITDQKADLNIPLGMHHRDLAPRFPVPENAVVALPACPFKTGILKQPYNITAVHPNALSIAASISLILNGWPETLLSGLQSTRYWSRSTVFNWPVFISGTITVS